MRGSIVKRGKTYSIVYDIGQGGNRKQKWESGFKTKKEAETALAKRITELEKGTYINPKKDTLGEYLLRWFETHKRDLAVSTARRYEGIINQHLIPGLGNIPLSKLQPLQIQEFLIEELENGRKDNKKTVGTGLSPSSVSYEYRVLHRALNQAVKWQLISRNPADLITPPKPEDKDKVILSELEISKLLDEIRETYLYIPTFIAIYTGMRLGEVLGLTWKDIDFNRGIIQVRQASCQVKADEPEFKAPKTAKSKRNIDISPEVVKTLKEHKKNQAKWRLAAGTAWQENNLVCTLQDGRPINPPTLSSYFRKVVAHLGLFVNFHGLRHTHASLLLKAGIPAKVVQERLGHSTIAVTMDIYSHVMPGMQREAANKLEDILKIGR